MIEELIKELRIDKDLYYAYQANIAMAFKDEFSRRRKTKKYNYFTRNDIHEVGNQAAKNFLDLLIREKLEKEEGKCLVSI
jgi:hypothetical protein